MELGLVAGSGRLPLLVARAAREAGHSVHGIAFPAETDAALAKEVVSLVWLNPGKVDGMVRRFHAVGVREAVFAGGLRRMRAAQRFRPDWGALRVMRRLKSFRDDALLREVASEFARQGIVFVAATQFVPRLLAEEGHLAGPALSAEQERDVTIGAEVAAALGSADVGQTVVIKAGTVLAVEAVEGTDACIRRGARLAGPGIVVVKRSKLGQDKRFDQPAIGPVTIEVLREVKAAVLAIDANETLLLDAPLALRWADRFAISLVGIRILDAPFKH